MIDFLFVMSISFYDLTVSVEMKNLGRRLPANAMII